MQIRGFDSYSNTPHEGTNNWMKHCAQPVTPNCTIDNAAYIRCEQGKLGCREREKLLGMHINRYALWSDLSCANDITRLCLALITKELDNAKEYSNIRVEADTFLVVRNDYTNVTGNIPVFRRVRSPIDIEIVDERDLPSKFHTLPAMDRVRNYSRLAVANALKETSASAVTTSTTQEEYLGEEDHDMMFSFENHEGSKENDDAPLSSNSFQELQPVFKEFINVLDGNAQDIRQMKHLANYKARKQITLPLKERNGSIVSSNPPAQKKRKTHGTKYSTYEK